MEKTVMDLAREDTQLKRVAVNEYAGPCPGCGGKDRFHVNLNKRDGRGAWMCRVCHPAEMNGWGDAIEYVRKFRGMSFQEARDFVREGLDSLIAKADQARSYVAPDENTPPREQWQNKAARYVDQARSRLYRTEGRACLEYLYKRGLQDATIKAAQLGYVEEEESGVLIPRLVIPWHAEDGQYWAVNRRDLREPLPEGAARYKVVPWSSKQAPYGSLMLNKKRVRATFIVEGELDALSLAQEAGDLPINVIATGGAGIPASKWIARLSYMPLVLVAYDREQRGEEMARKWLDILKLNAIRYRPLAKDVNAMLVEGWSIRSWVEGALERYGLFPNQDQATTTPAGDLVEQKPDMATAPAPAQEMTGDQVSPDVCACGAPSWIIGEDQRGYCKACWRAQGHTPAQDEACVLCGDFADVVNEDERFYCQSCYSRLQLEQDATGDQVEQQEDAGAAFLDQVRTLVDNAGAWPGGYSLRLVDRAFVEQIRALPDLVPVEHVERSSLEALPRKHCAGLVLTTTDIPGETKKNRSQVLRPCTGKPCANGWCEAHKHAALLLDMGAALGYPRVEISDCNVIPAGLVSWESYAARSHTAMRAALPRVKRLLDQAQGKQDKAAS